MPLPHVPTSPVLPSPVAPVSGRLCFRALRDGEALVGIMQFPPAFTPLEGNIYLMHCTSSRLAVFPEPVSGGMGPEMRTYGVGDLLRASVWPCTTTPDVRPVSFLLAFPEENRWTVFGPSPVAPPAGTPDHRWVDIHAGIPEQIAPQVDATGMAISKILTQAPVWPNEAGVLHTLPQISGAGRGAFYRQSRLFAAAARDPDLFQSLGERRRADPELYQLGAGRADQEYCAYLAALADRGLLDVDRPRSAAEVAQRKAVAEEIVRAMFQDADLPSADHVSAPPPSQSSSRPAGRRIR